MKYPDNTLLMYFPAEHVNGMLAVFVTVFRTFPKAKEKKHFTKLSCSSVTINLRLIRA